MKADKILIPRWIIPVVPRGAVLEGHFLAIRDGRILAIAPISELADFEADEIEQLENCALMPGLINCHTHASMNLLRCVGPDLTTPQWLTECIWPIEGKLMSPEFVYQGALLGGAEMIHGGTTMCHDMYFYGAEAARGLRENGLRVVEGAFVIGFPSKEYSGEAQCLQGAEKLFASAADDDLLSINLAPHAPYSVSKEALQASMQLAQTLDTTWQIHLSETDEERENAIKAFGCSPVEYLSRIGCLNESTAAVHCVSLSDRDIEILSKSGASVIHCPVSNMRLGCGASPVAKLLEAGVNTALGTDGAASACTLSMFEQMRTAGMIAKGFSKDPCALNVNQIIEMATINGAKALKSDERVGSLEIGKDADLIAIDLSRFVTVPVLDVLSCLVYAVEAQCVYQVWVKGGCVVKKQHKSAQKSDLGELLTKSDLMSWQNRVCEILQDGSR